MPVVAPISFAAAVLETTILPVVAVRETDPAAVSTPVTDPTVPTVKPSASVKLILPVEVSTPSVAIFVAAALNVTVPAAVTDRLVSPIPPAVAVTVEPLTRLSVVTPVPPVDPGDTSAETVMAPAVASPIVRLAAVIDCNSAAESSTVLPAASVAEPISTAALFVGVSVVDCVPLSSAPDRATLLAMICSALFVVLSVLEAAIVNVPLPLVSSSASTTVAPAVVRLSFRVTPLLAFRVSAPAPDIFPFVASSVMEPADASVSPAVNVTSSFASALLSTSPSSDRFPVSVEILTPTEIRSSALTSSALNVDAVVTKETVELSAAAFSVTVPVMLLLLAAVMPSTTILPAVASPMVRPVAVMF